MVGFKNLAWLQEPNHRRLAADGKKESSNLGILAFETAKIMSKLVSLYKSLSIEGISRLQNDVVRSRGVQFLNSMDEEYLLSLACAEKLEDLDRAASAVSCLGKKCNDFGLNRFDIIYTDLKLGIANFGKLESHGSRVSEKKMRKMEKLVSTTSCLQAALEALTEMEISERRLKQLTNRQIEMMKINLDDFNEKLENQRKEVRYFRENSLWTQTFDKSVDLMARIVCVVYLKICAVFGPQRMFLQGKIVSHSGPLLTKSKPIMVRFYSQRSIDFPAEGETAKSNSNGVFHSAGPETVGGSGLTTRYANLIILAEKYLDSKVSISPDEREAFYQMVPENVKSVLRTKLSRKMRCAESDASLAEGWRDAMAEMMSWLAPMAHDSVKWQMERKLERMKFDDADKANSVLLLQTLHFSDKEKTEAAIAEVLVGLSCIFRFENRQLCV
ncbi:hypothetical protein PHJA_002624300 [Phtheirospermum japonicum]|uniref:Uncharacterized protein n=1 Tax=Phtheirospermum japonicum TaxID=374723 RepID=A0A830D2C9_9LAMI|nr:hypothetical protein PHJA_002624300 [Phtheirospermum japonicum]